MFCESHFSFKAPLLWAASDGLSTESLVKGTHIGPMLANSDLAVSWEVWPPHLLPAALVGRTVDPWWQDLGRWRWWNKVSRSSFQSGHKTQKYLISPYFRKSWHSRTVENMWMGIISLCCCCSFAKSCLTPCDPMDCSTVGSPVLHYLLEFAQTHVHWVGDATAISQYHIANEVSVLKHYCWFPDFFKE